MAAKEIRFHSDARERMLRGIDRAVEIGRASCRERVTDTV